MGIRLKHPIWLLLPVVAVLSGLATYFVTTTYFAKNEIPRPLLNATDAINLAKSHTATQTVRTTFSDPIILRWDAGGGTTWHQASQPLSLFLNAYSWSARFKADGYWIVQALNTQAEKPREVPSVLSFVVDDRTGKVTGP